MSQKHSTLFSTSRDGGSGVADVAVAIPMSKLIVYGSAISLIGANRMCMYTFSAIPQAHTCRRRFCNCASVEGLEPRLHNGMLIKCYSIVGAAITPPT